MYEIEFHRVGDGNSSGDAISLRYFDGAAWRVGVIDAGYTQNGEDLCAHIRKFYGTETVNFVVSTHPDNDHMSGLRAVLREMNVEQLWMHVPWLHAGRIQHLFRSSRWQLVNLEDAIRRSYPFVEELVQLASAQGTKIELPFAGSQIGPFTVLSPSVDMYEGLLPQFRDTPQCDQLMLSSLGHWIQNIGRRVSSNLTRRITEAWNVETLREGGTTAAENESSVVLLGTFQNERVLLTGDAGLVALKEAVKFAAAQGLAMARPNIFQVPHHGSRNNISPSMLDYLIGQAASPGSSSVRAVVSAGAQDEHHPRQVVVNALQRRGCVPHSTKVGTLRFGGNGMPSREGWNTAASLPFSQLVEAYD